MPWHAEFEQDRIAWELCDKRREGVFIDIGATDGVTRNNTLALERDYGWSGICIEPVLASFVKLRANRACATLCAAIAGYDRLGVVSFHEDAGNHEISRIDVNGAHWSPCLTINHVLARLAGRPVSYLSIDTEGSELDILASLDFSRYPIRVIDFEHNAHWGPVQQANKDAISALLIARGYRKHCDVGVDSIFLRQ